MYTRVNARFWQYLNGSPVKLTLRPGQRFSWFCKEPHEEGWSSEFQRWGLDERGWLVFNEWETDGRDCDGRLSRSGAAYAGISMLDAHIVDEPYADYHEGKAIRYPKWKAAQDTVVYDEYAQAAGY
jgi:hypothetical protein